jgi:hypothetical protein
MFYGNHSATVLARNHDSMDGRSLSACLVRDFGPISLSPFNSPEQTISHRFRRLQLRVVTNVIQRK